jgi:tripartite ATP-independent transporter DctM subunit
MIILFASLAFFLVFGVPVAYALGLSSLCYFVVLHPELLPAIPQRIYAGMNSYVMIALPLFVMMGLTMNEAGVSRRVIDFCQLFVGRIRGGLGAVNVLDSMVFGGISGSSVSDTASLGAWMIPEMRRRGYSDEISTGLTVATSTFGMIIPPSVPMVVYALVSEESVGRLFLAGAVPGVLIGLVMLVMVIVMAYRKRWPREEVVLTPRQWFRRVLDCLPAIIMPIFVVGAVVLGIVTATESAAVGVLYALLIGLLVTRELKLRAIPKVMKSAILTSATVMMVIATSSLYSWILALEKVPQAVGAFVSGLNLSPVVYLLVVDVIILATGTFVDVSPAILLLTPVFLPAARLLGISGIQFGAIMIVGLAIGLITPPVGMCLYVASTISKVTIGRIFKGAAPFLLANLLVLALISVFPDLSLWLPKLLMK